MAGVGCVMITSIPRTVRRPALHKHFTNTTTGGGPVEYILHPLGNDLSKAVIKFTDEKTAGYVVQYDHLIEGKVVDVAPLPRQVLGQCTATVDPTIVSGLPDLVACMDLLRNDFGVKVHYDPLKHVMSTSGSFLQLQFAQTALSSIYREQEEKRQQVLAEAAERVLNVPSSKSATARRTPAHRNSECYETPPQTLRMEDLTASQSQLPSSRSQSQLPSSRSTDGSSWLMANSGKSTGKSVASAIMESSLLHSSTSSHFKPYKTSRTSDRSGPQGESLKTGRTSNRSGHQGESLYRSSGPQGESLYSSNAKAVDDLFSASMPRTRSGPRSSESIPDELTDTGELLNTWGNVGEAGGKVVVEFDTQVFNFMRRIHGQSLKDLERSYQVQLQYRKSGDTTMVRILPAGGEEGEGGLGAIHQAKKPLINLYHTVFKNVIKIVVSLDKVPPQMKTKVETVVGRVKESFKSVLYMDMRDVRDVRRRVTLVGQQQHAEAAEERLRTELNLKKDRDIIKPKMVFMMQSQRSQHSQSVSASKSTDASCVTDALDLDVDESVDASRSLDASQTVPVLDREPSHRSTTPSNKTPPTSPPLSTRSIPASTRVPQPVRDGQVQSDSNQQPRATTTSRDGVTSLRGSISARETSTRDVFSPRSTSGSQTERIPSPAWSDRSQGERIPSPAWSDRSQSERRSPGESRSSSRGSVERPREAGRREEEDADQNMVKPHSGRSTPSRMFSPPPKQSRFSPRMTPGSSHGRPDETRTLDRQDGRRAAWSTPEPGVSGGQPTQPGVSGQSIKPGISGQSSIQPGVSNGQYSQLTSMTGVTPLSSTNMSGTGEFTALSYGSSTHQSYSHDYNELGQSQTEPDQPDQSLADPVTDLNDLVIVGQSLNVDLSQSLGAPLTSSTLKDTGSSLKVTGSSLKDTGGSLKVTGGFLKDTGGSLLDRISLMSTGELPSAREAHRPSRFKFMTREGIKVSVYSGKMSEARVDAIICPTQEDMRLLHGLALDISQAAGHQLQESCTARVAEKGSLKVSQCFAAAASGSLACQYVLLSACPMWCLHPEKVECEELLKRTLINAFIYADEKLKVDSLALPAVGTGEHGIPADVCGWALLAAIEEFSSTSSSTASSASSSTASSTSSQRNIKQIHIINSDQRITGVIGDTLEEVLDERHSQQATPLTTPHDSRRGSADRDVMPLTSDSVDKSAMPLTSDSVYKAAMPLTAPHDSVDKSAMPLSTPHDSVDKAAMPLTSPHDSVDEAAMPLTTPHDSVDKGVPFIIKLVAACVSVAERSGGIIRDIMKRGELGIVDKGINDLQTEADRSAERCIVASLHALYPALTVVGEEGTSHLQASDINPDWLETSLSPSVLSQRLVISRELEEVSVEDVVVWVDPLDGTSEYTQGLVEHVTTLIGIAVNGHATAGVIHQPFYTSQTASDDVTHGRSVWGVIGAGSYGYSHGLSPEGLGDNVIVTTRSHGSGAVGAAVDACRPSDVVRAGGCGHKVMMVLEGQAHAYVFASPGCKKWDTAAPEAVLEAAGGRLTDVHGNHLTYGAHVQTRNSAGVVATPPGANHTWYIDHIPDDVKQSLPEVMEAGKLADPRHTVQPIGKVADPRHTVQPIGKVADPRHTVQPIGKVADPRHTVQQIGKVADPRHTVQPIGKVADPRHTVQPIGKVADPRHTVQPIGKVADPRHTVQPIGKVADPRHTVQPIGKVADPRHTVQPIGKVADPRHTVQPIGKVADPRHTVQPIGNTGHTVQQIGDPRNTGQETGNVEHKTQGMTGQALHDEKDGPDPGHQAENDGQKDSILQEGSLGEPGKEGPGLVGPGEGEPGQDEMAEVLSHGTMTYEVNRKLQIPGFPDTSALVITYTFPPTRQGGEDVAFTAYLPSNAAGRRCLQLLRQAFDLGLVFTMVKAGDGRRRITWSDIPHKDRLEAGGGGDGNGYPDEEYLDLLKRKLSEKGVTD